MLPEVLRRRIAQWSEALDDQAMLGRLKDFERAVETDFSALEKVIIFVGYPRSGHSLLGALLAAHPQAIISHELNLLSLHRRGLSRDRLLELVVARERQFASTQRRWEGYDYSIGAWGGEPERPRLMGDKKGSGTALVLERDPGALRSLEEALQLPVYVLHVMRHPLDNLATIATRERSTLVEALAKFKRRVETVERIRAAWPQEKWVDLRYEDLVADVNSTLRRLLAWLELPATDAYLDACAQAVFKSAPKTRSQVDWRPIQADVDALIDAHDFLSGYRADAVVDAP